MNLEDEDMDHIFHCEVKPGLYILCDDRQSPTDDPKSLVPGKPTGNSYLVVGSEKAILLDLALDNKSLKEYAENLAGVPVQLVLSHAHVDHIYHITQFPEVWLHPDDEKLLRHGAVFQRPVKNCPPLHFLRDGEIIDLGNRILDVIHLPGHTDGSILLIDRNTRTLLGGDTVARHLLHGMHTKIPPEEIIRRMEALKDLHFDTIYCTHDRCSLPKSHIDLIQEVLRRYPIEGKLQTIPLLTKIRTFSIGAQTELHYCDVAAVEHK